MKCPKCQYTFDNSYYCTCHHLTIFDIDVFVTGKHTGEEFCLKCGKVLDNEKVELILGRTGKKY